MSQQLIINFLGEDKPGLLSAIATSVNDASCNILDSRQAIFGQELSLTMIIEGTQAAITRFELIIPTLCQSLDLLAMMKRTKHHEKQHLAHLINIEFSGKDIQGLLGDVTVFFHEQHASISALRQKTFTNPETKQECVRCKIVLTVPDAVAIKEFIAQTNTFLTSLSLDATITDTHQTTWSD